MRKFLRKFGQVVIGGVVGAAIFAGVFGAQAAFYQWSKTASTNATADATVNWAEGMSPGSVNDSARAMMARLAEYRDDTSGSLTTGGTSTAYTLTTNQGFPATPSDGQTVAFTLHAANGATPTLRIDGGSIIPIETTPGTAVPAGSLIAGSVYQVKYSTSSGGSYVLFNFFSQPFEVPLGTALPWTGTAVPNSNFVFAAGQCISRTTYAAYFALVSTTYGGGGACGASDFPVPDLRGRAVAGKDNMGGTSANRLTGLSGGVNGDTLGDTGGVETHTLTTAQLPSHTHTITDPGHDHDFLVSSGTADQVNPSSARSIASGNNIYRAAAPDTELREGAISEATTGITIANTGSGSAHNNVQPTIILNYIIRVL